MNLLSFLDLVPLIFKMYPICAVAFALMLTKIYVGTTQLNGKKPQSKLLRNSSGRDYASETPSSPPLLESTAIDPLSHVCFPAQDACHYERPEPTLIYIPVAYSKEDAY